MRNIIVAGAVALALGAAPAAFAQSKPARGAGPAVPTQAEVDALRSELQRLSDRLRELEARQAEVATKADGAAQQTAKVDTRLNEIEASNDNQTDQIAKSKAKLDSAEWASRVKWKGDFRYRNETFNVENTQDRWRDRIRVRAGLDAKVNDTINFGLQIATGDDLDPRSTNATLGESLQRRAVRLDLAYVDWTAFSGGVVTLGKQKQPWFRPGNSLFYDGDVNPEGGSLKYTNASGLFGSVWGFWLRESGAAADANMYGAQLGWKSPIGLTVALGYTDYGAIQNKPILTFTDSPAGNSTYRGSAVAGAVCTPLATGTNTCYQYDYQLLQAGVQYDMKVGALPLMLFADYVNNQDPKDLNTGYTGGFLLGKAGNPGSWEFGALYQKMERDAQFGLFLDSDFAGGLTQGKGWALRGGYAPAKNVVLNATYFINTRSFDTPSEVDYKRLQLDANFKF